MSFLASSYNTKLEKSASANTVVIVMIEPMHNYKTYLTSLIYTTGNTANVVTIMRPLGQTKVTTAVAANTPSAALAIAADPGIYSANKTWGTADNAIAANDLVVVELADGTWFQDKLAAANTTTATLTTTLPVLCGIAAGAKLWFFGITTDTNPSDRLAHPKITSAVNTVGEALVGDKPGEAESLSIGTYGAYEPLLISCDNSTGTNFLRRATAVYLNRGGPFVSNVPAGATT